MHIYLTTEAEQQERAFTLGLAGLLGEGVYNFGELVSACRTGVIYLM